MIFFFLFLSVNLLSRLPAKYFLLNLSLRSSILCYVPDPGILLFHLYCITMILLILSNCSRSMYFLYIQLYRAELREECIVASLTFFLSICARHGNRPPSTSHFTLHDHEYDPFRTTCKLVIEYSRAFQILDIVYILRFVKSSNSFVYSN